MAHSRMHAPTGQRGQQEQCRTEPAAAAACFKASGLARLAGPRMLQQLQQRGKRAADVPRHIHALPRPRALRVAKAAHGALRHARARRHLCLRAVWAGRVAGHSLPGRRQHATGEGPLPTAACRSRCCCPPAAGKWQPRAHTVHTPQAACGQQPRPPRCARRKLPAQPLPEPGWPAGSAPGLQGRTPPPPLPAGAAPVHVAWAWAGLAGRGSGTQQLPSLPQPHSLALSPLALHAPLPPAHRSQTQSRRPAAQPRRRPPRRAARGRRCARAPLPLLPPASWQRTQVRAAPHRRACLREAQRPVGGGAQDAGRTRVDRCTYWQARGTRTVHPTYTRRGRPPARARRLPAGACPAAVCARRPGRRPPHRRTAASPSQAGPRARSRPG